MTQECPRCKSLRLPDANFCGRCGLSFGDEERASSAPYNPLAAQVANLPSGQSRSIPTGRSALPMNLGDSTLLCFVEIPFCVSSSFITTCASHFGEDRWVRMQNAKQFTPQPGPGAFFVSGPGQHSDFAYGNDNHHVFTTILRDPIQRSLAYYSFHRGRPDSSFHELALNLGPLDFFTTPGDHTLPVADYQTRVFSDRLNDFNLAPDFIMAVTRLRESYTFVGTWESIETTTELFCHAFNWPHNPQVSPASEHPEQNGVVVDGALRNAISEINRLDLMLHRAGKLLFERELEALRAKQFEQQAVSLSISSEELEGRLAKLQSEIASQVNPATMLGTKGQPAWEKLRSCLTSDAHILTSDYDKNRFSNLCEPKTFGPSNGLSW